ncbi:MAG: hypothetical protein CM15mP120_20740 [Pseudomonadota bacterium]|nr:MAG: hypothetical protein CM15mP120_20740 [Pseudomonadota bacterium]
MGNFFQRRSKKKILRGICSVFGRSFTTHRIRKLMAGDQVRPPKFGQCCRTNGLFGPGGPCEGNLVGRFPGPKGLTIPAKKWAALAADLSCVGGVPGVPLFPQKNG